MWAKNNRNGFQQAMRQYSLETFYNRLPRVVNQVINYFDNCSQFYVNKHLKQNPLNSKLIQDQINDDKEQILKELNNLLVKVRSNDELFKFNDGHNDLKYWNDYLKNYENDFNKPARFKEMNSIAVESYLYRSLHSIFTTSTKSNFFKSFDPFYDQKLDSIRSTNSASNLMFTECLNIKNRMKNDKFDLYKEFATFLHYSLWGNRADLTVPAGLNLQNDMKTNQNYSLSDDVTSRKENILTDQTKDVFNLFQQFKNKDNLRIDLILDNGSLEFISDLCFIEMLYQTQLIKPNTTIRFFVKSFNWFVSDVTPADFFSHLKYLYFYAFTEENQKRMVLNWNHLISTNKWQLVVNPFFTTPNEYYKMKRLCPELYDDFSKSDLLIFKGDLNYVKLLGNLLWPPSTPFDIAIQDFKPTNLITLRTAKYNLVVNLDDENILKDLPNRWYANGDYAMISMYKKD